MKKVKLFAWSDCCQEWQFYDYYYSEDEIKAMIKEGGFDERFFKWDNA